MKKMNYQALRRMCVPFMIHTFIWLRRKTFSGNTLESQISNPSSGIILQSTAKQLL